MMGNPIKYILILGIGMLWASCEDVIEIQTEDVPARVTIDAWLNDLPGPQIIRITESQPYFQNTFTPGRAGAIVQLLSDRGELFDFEDMNDGNYQWTPPTDSTFGVVGVTYTLTVLLNGRELSSTSTMRASPAVDRITQEYREDELGGPDGIYAEFFARDLQGLGDTYWIKTFKNDLFLNKPDEINIAYDGGFDAGAEIDGIIFVPPIRELVNPVPDSIQEADDIPRYDVGDRIRVEIHSISVDAFLFLESTRDQILNGNNTIFASPLSNTPGNVVSLSDNDEVLGVFCVSSVSSLEKQIE